MFPAEVASDEKTHSDVELSDSHYNNNPSAILQLCIYPLKETAVRENAYFRKRSRAVNNVGTESGPGIFRIVGGELHLRQAVGGGVRSVDFPKDHFSHMQRVK